MDGSRGPPNHLGRRAWDGCIACASRILIQGWAGVAEKAEPNSPVSDRAPPVNWDLSWIVCLPIVE